MKRHLLILAILLICFSCKKQTNTQFPKSMDNIVVPSNFNWQTTRLLELKLHSSKPQIVSIASSDNQSAYSKFYFSGNDSLMQSKINIPTDESSIYINTVEVSFETETELLEVDLDTIINKITAINKTTNRDGLISVWHLDEGFGKDIYDSESNNDGLMENATWINGILNSGLAFNSENSKVSIPDSSNLNVYQTFTLMAWANIHENKTAAIIQKGNGDSYGLSYVEGDGWSAHLGLSNGASINLNWNSGLPIINQWHHLALTYDGTTAKFYVNGILENSQNATGLINQDTNSLCMGYDNREGAFFNGDIDEILLYGKTLTAHEILNYYRSMENTDNDSDGIPNEDDDYPDDSLKAFNNYWPNKTYGTLMFEDTWPTAGDYDYNDMVLDFKINSITDASNKLWEIKFTFLLKAIGTELSNGFGFQIDNDVMETGDLVATGSQLVSDYIVLNYNGLETMQDKAVIIVFDDANKLMPSVSGYGVNVEKDQSYVQPMEFEITIKLPQGKYDAEAFRAADFNPFIIINKERAKEVHLANFPPTSLADKSLMGTSDDNSNIMSGNYYTTSDNLPWAILVSRSIYQTLEQTQITSGYLKLYEWASSGGQEYKYWFRKNSGNINENSLYLPPKK